MISDTAKTSLTGHPLAGYCVIAVAIILSTWIFSRAPRYVQLPTGELLNQTDGTVYRHAGHMNNRRHRYIYQPGPSYL